MSQTTTRQREIAGVAQLVPHLSRIMYYVYILQGKRDNSIYVGYTPDLRKRVQEHTKGHVLSTKNIRPIELVYYEAYKAKSDAIKREQALKLHKKALAQLKVRISQSLIGGG